MEKRDKPQMAQISQSGVRKAPFARRTWFNLSVVLQTYKLLNLADIRA
jgi:hypothetical protein